MFGTSILCNNDLNREHVKKKKERKKIAPLGKTISCYSFKGCWQSEKNEKRVMAWR